MIFLKVVVPPNGLKNAITTELFTVPYSKGTGYSIRVASTPPDWNSQLPNTQSILTLNMLPPVLQNMIAQEDLDWFIFNLGGIIKTYGSVLTGLTKIDLAHLESQGVGEWLRNFTHDVTNTVIHFTGGITGNIINYLSTTAVNSLSNFGVYLKPVSEGGDGGGDTIANSLANMLQSTASYIRNGVTSIINGVFKGSSNVFDAVLPLGVNVFVLNAFQQLPETVQEGMNVIGLLATNAINNITQSIFHWGKTLGGYGGEELNLALPRILNVEKQDLICKWMEWLFFDSDFGKWENQANPLARLSKEQTYKSICYQTTVGMGGTEVPIAPVGTFWLPHQVKSFVNGLWKLSWASRPEPCELKDGKLICGREVMK